MKILVISDIHAMSKDLLDLTESTQQNLVGKQKVGIVAQREEMFLLKKGLLGKTGF